MCGESEDDYHRRRAKQEFRLGCVATDRQAAAAHFKLFDLHLLKVGNLEPVVGLPTVAITSGI